MADLAAPALDQRRADLAAAQLGDGGGDRTGRQPGELRDRELGRALDLEPADERAAEHVAGIPHRDREMNEPIVAARMRVADVALDPGGARGRTDEAELVGDLRGDAPGVLEPRLVRRGLPQ